MQPWGGSVPLAAGQGFAGPHWSTVRVPLPSTGDLSGGTPGLSLDVSLSDRSVQCLVRTCVGLGTL